MGLSVVVLGTRSNIISSRIIIIRIVIFFGQLCSIKSGYANYAAHFYLFFLLRKYAQTIKTCDREMTET